MLSLVPLYRIPILQSPKREFSQLNALSHLDNGFGLTTDQFNALFEGCKSCDRIFLKRTIAVVGHNCGPVPSGRPALNPDRSLSFLLEASHEDGVAAKNFWACLAQCCHCLLVFKKSKDFTLNHGGSCAANIVLGLEWHYPTTS